MVCEFLCGGPVETLACARRSTAEPSLRSRMMDLHSSLQSSAGEHNDTSPNIRDESFRNSRWFPFEPTATEPAQPHAAGPPQGRLQRSVSSRVRVWAIALFRAELAPGAPLVQTALVAFDRAFAAIGSCRGACLIVWSRPFLRSESWGWVPPQKRLPPVHSSCNGTTLSPSAMFPATVRTKTPRWSCWSSGSMWKFWKPSPR